MLHRARRGLGPAPSTDTPQAKKGVHPHGARDSAPSPACTHLVSSDLHGWKGVPPACLRQRVLRREGQAAAPGPCAGHGPPVRLGSRAQHACPWRPGWMRLEPPWEGHSNLPRMQEAFAGLGQPRVPARSLSQLLTVSRQQVPEGALGRGPGLCHGQTDAWQAPVSPTSETHPPARLSAHPGHQGGSLDSHPAPRLSSHSSQTNPNKGGGTPRAPCPSHRVWRHSPQGLTSPWPPPLAHAVPASLGSGPQGHSALLKGIRHSLPRGLCTGCSPAWTAVPVLHLSPLHAFTTPGSLLNATFQGGPHRSTKLKPRPPPHSIPNPLLSAFAAPTCRGFPCAAFLPCRCPGSVSAQGTWLLCWLCSPSADTCTRPTGLVRPAGPGVGLLTCATPNEHPACPTPNPRWPPSLQGGRARVLS